MHKFSQNILHSDRRSKKIKKEKVKKTAATVAGFSDIKREPITGWQEFLEEGNQFLATAVNAHAKSKKAFTPEILYNLVAMAIEKLIMALLMKSGNLPYNHTMHDLVEAMVAAAPASLAGKHVVVTAGPTYEPIDPVRFLGNRSSLKGKNQY